MTILVTGGAGYIGSHMVQALLAAGYPVRVLDNLSTGHADAIPSSLLVRGDIGDAALLNRLFADTPIDAVFHFAGFIQVAESVREPALYYQNNVDGTRVLLDAMRRHAIERLVFSSSAAVYGTPSASPVPETAPFAPINPYGRSKAFVELMLQDYAAAYGLRSVSLRYFNAAGADPAGRLGERHEPETHLIPRILRVAGGQDRGITLFGTDYDTPDGSCIRDYVHVVDLCEAHLLALQYLQQHPGATAFNLGNGTGHSVRAVIAAAQRVTGRSIPVIEAPRRPGDPAVLVASSTRARQELPWQPKYGHLVRIIEDAWRWYCRSQ
ncbi:MAG TPA: UDP-glucose 4-epimerase GalE [Acidiferrobacteraceae bacterium]|nr:UDP-glucose 4-epimerase GalE [Acidiferrobacteraceae bacterium]